MSFSNFKNKNSIVTFQLADFPLPGYNNVRAKIITVSDFTLPHPVEMRKDFMKKSNAERTRIYRKNNPLRRRPTLPVLIILVIILILSLTGCGQRESDTSLTSGDGESSVRELEVWVFFDENTPGSYYVDLWNELGAETGFEITVRTYSSEQIKDKLKIALVCGELPDMFVVWGGNYPNFLFDAGACLPVEDYLEQADFTFKESYTEPYSDGHNYIIPCLVEAYAVTYYNQDLMNLMNLTAPDTWEDLIKLVEQVEQYNEENGTDYAAIELGDKDSWLGELLYTTIVNRIDPYALDQLADGRIDFTADIFSDAADKLLYLKEIGAFPDKFLETGEVEAVHNFINGLAVLFPHQSTIVYYLMQNMGEYDFSMRQFPSCSEEYNDTYSSYLIDINHTLTPGLCISSGTEYPDEAAELCLAFARKVNEINVTEYDYLDMIEDSGLVPAADSPLPVNQLHQMVDQAEKFTPFWYAILEKEDGDNWRNLTKKLLGDAISKEAFLEDARQYLNFPEEIP